MRKYLNQLTAWILLKPPIRSPHIHRVVCQTFDTVSKLDWTGTQFGRTFFDSFMFESFAFSTKETYIRDTGALSCIQRRTLPADEEWDCGVQAVTLLCQYPLYCTRQELFLVSVMSEVAACFIASFWWHKISIIRYTLSFRTHMERIVFRT